MFGFTDEEHAAAQRAFQQVISGFGQVQPELSNARAEKAQSEPVSDVEGGANQRVCFNAPSNSDQSAPLKNQGVNTDPIEKNNSETLDEEEIGLFFIALFTIYEVFIKFPFDVIDTILYVVFDLLDIILTKTVLLPLYMILGQPAKRSRAAIFRYFTPVTLTFSLVTLVFIFYQPLLSSTIDILIDAQGQLEKRRTWNVHSSVLNTQLSELGDRIKGQDQRFQTLYANQKQIYDEISKKNSLTIVKLGQVKDRIDQYMYQAEQTSRELKELPDRIKKEITDDMMDYIKGELTTSIKSEVVKAITTDAYANEKKYLTQFLKTTIKDQVALLDYEVALDQIREFLKSRDIDDAFIDTIQDYIKNVTRSDESSSLETTVKSSTSKSTTTNTGGIIKMLVSSLLSNRESTVATLDTNDLASKQSTTSEHEDLVKYLTHTLDEVYPIVVKEGEHTASTKSSSSTSSALPSQKIDALSIDYASETQGGRIILDRTTPLLKSSESKSSDPYGPYRVLEETHKTFGDCWTFSGNQGLLAIELKKPIFISSITIEQPAEIPFETEIQSSIKSFKLYGILNYQSWLYSELLVHLGEFTYMIDSEPKQIFHIDKSKHKFKAFVVRIEDNWGSLYYTNIYKVRLNGTLE